MKAKLLNHWLRMRPIVIVYAQWVEPHTFKLLPRKKVKKQFQISADQRAHQLPDRRSAWQFIDEVEPLISIERANGCGESTVISQSKIERPCISADSIKPPCNPLVGYVRMLWKDSLKEVLVVFIDMLDNSPLPIFK